MFKRSPIPVTIALLAGVSQNIFLPATVHAAAPADLQVSLLSDLTQLDLSLYNDSKELDFMPNNAPVPKIKVEYGGLGFTYGGRSSKQDDTLDLKTSARDFSAFLYKKNRGIDLYYQQYKGYLIDHDPLTAQSYYPDLATRTFTFNYYQKLGGASPVELMNKPALTQPGFAGLYYFVGGLSDRRVDSQRPLLPSTETANFPAIADLSQFHALGASISAGAYIALRKHHWYINSGMSVGGGLALDQSGSDANVNSIIKVNLKLGTGFLGQRFQLGLIGANDSDAFILDQGDTIQFHSIGVVLFITYHPGHQSDHPGSSQAHDR